ncbi:hypothetical protein Desti_3352 [Desulfomonile tiedjei DSM 6799]|uniref:Uncharacterized protein n=1 Tax=Desulfomonile tiedjei (strain ATCC 49306 / DSM 6799 / DCB-1) TaxID=706587 RepID=I4C8W7_DESTA|nr:hypothetical protein Desti_3352 [Desulfomonile tiedjei DSM 6799]
MSCLFFQFRLQCAAVDTDKLRHLLFGRPNMPRKSDVDLRSLGLDNGGKGMHMRFPLALGSGAIGTWGFLTCSSF